MLKLMQRSILLLFLIILVIMGLDISNNSINALTKESWGSVLGFSMAQDNINISLIGNTYSFNINSAVDITCELKQVVTSEVKGYYTRYLKIIEALLGLNLPGENYR